MEKQYTLFHNAHYLNGLNTQDANTKSSSIWRPRDKQVLPKGNWFTWLILAGRGFGKTRTGAENVMLLIQSGQYKSIAIIGETIKEAIQIMVEGMSGLCSSMALKQANLLYKRINNKIIFSNGAVVYVLGGDRPDTLRGFQFDLVWIDEFAKFKHAAELWEQVLFCLRIGNDPKCIITTTPRPLPILKDISESKDTIYTTGSTFENTDNLSRRFIATMQGTYRDTRVGRQELYGELIFEKERPLWKLENIRYNKIDINLIERVVIGVDPAVTNTNNSDETGIIVAGLGLDRKIYVLDDLSGKYTGTEWAKIVVRASIDYNASCVVVETNNGGDLVTENLRSIDSNLPIRKVRAVKGKVARAEPISILYETDRVLHSKQFSKLESQMLNMSYDDEFEPPGRCSKDMKSPDRVDALVWAISELRNMENRNHCRFSIVDLQ